MTPTHETPATRVALLASSAASEGELLSEMPSSAAVVFRSGSQKVLTDTSVRRGFRNADPEVVILEGAFPESLLQLVSHIHRDVPESWILAVCDESDSQLIIQVVRAGAREILSRPVSQVAIQEALGRYLAEHPERRREPGKVIAVTSAKGGCGATSIAINLAAAMAKLPDTRVSLADLTFPLGDVAAYLSLKPEYTLVDALKAASRLDPVLLETFMTSKAGTSILAGKGQIQELPGSEEDVLKLLDVLSQTFSHSVLDLSGAVSKDLIHAAAEKASEVLVVLTAEVPAVWRTHRLLEYLEELGASERVKVLLNRSEKSTEITPGDVEKALKRSIYRELPNNYRATIKSINAGLPVVEVNHSNLARSYEELAVDLTGIRPRKEKRFLGGLFGRS